MHVIAERYRKFYWAFLRNNSRRKQMKVSSKKNKAKEKKPSDVSEVPTEDEEIEELRRRVQDEAPETGQQLKRFAIGLPYSKTTSYAVL